MEESQSVENYGLELIDELPRDRGRVKVSAGGSMNYQYKGFIGGNLSLYSPPERSTPLAKARYVAINQYTQIARWARCAGEVGTVTDVG